MKHLLAIFFQMKYVTSFLISVTVYFYFIFNDGILIVTLIKSSEV